MSIDKVMSAGRGNPVRVLALLSVVFLAGCASIPSGSGFTDVQQQVGKRLDQKVQWNRGGAEDEAVSKAVRDLLQDTLTVDEAVQIALLNNRELQAEFERLGIAQADLVQAGLLSNPVFSVGIMNSIAGTERTLSVVEDFMNVFTLSARARVASSNFEQVKAEVAAKVLTLAADVRAMYYTVEGDEQALEMLQSVVGATEAAADLAQRQYQAGTLNRLNQNLHQTFYAQTLLEQAHTETQLNSDREKLNRLLGLWGVDVNWKVPRRLAELPDDMPALDRLESLAVAQRLDLAAAQKEIEAITYALDMNRNYRFLSVFGIGFTTQRAADGESVQGPSIELGLPLFDQGQARVAGLEAQRRAAEQRMGALAVDIRSQVREARGKLLAAREEVKYHRAVLLPLNEQIVNETQLRYNGMLLGVYDLLLAKQNQINAGRAYIQSLRDYWIAYVELERALGGRLAAAGATPEPASAPESAPAPASNPTPSKTPSHEGGH